jgi:CheY-like chemotaxis protein
MGSKVLLADDSVTIQKVVGIIFANEDYDLTIVPTGDDAVRKAGEIIPDVMLVDALMPGKNGYEVCREIRQNPKLSHVAILLMTGAFEVVDEEKNRLSGADEFIVKPFESQVLIDATNRMIALTAEPAAVAAPSVDDVWASGFDTEPVAAARQEPVQPVIQAGSSPAPVQVSSDDDLWGAFDMDSFEDSPPVQTPIPVAATTADDFFSFAEESPKPVESPSWDDFTPEPAAIQQPVYETAPTASGFEPVGEQEISFATDEPAPVKAAAAVAMPLDHDFSTISFDEPEPVPAAPPLPPVVETAPPALPVVPAPPPIPEPTPVAPAISAAPAALDEAQLRTLLSTVSREMIERIVWEVVPDLAETIIKEEIRKLKAGIA